jgi:hypothetical protein
MPLYVPTNWVEQVTTLGPTNMNHLENGVAAALPMDTVTIAAARVLASKLLVGDAQPAFRILGSGELDWGPGGAAVTDTNLYRGAAGVVKTDGILNAVGGLQVNGIPIAAVPAAPADPFQVLMGDPAWRPHNGPVVSVTVSAANTDLVAPTRMHEYWNITTGGGTLRSIGAAPQVGWRISLRNGGADATLLNLTAGGGPQLVLVPQASRVLSGGTNNEVAEFVYDGTNWVEVANARLVSAAGVTKIASTTLGAAAASFDFTSIPQTYTSLQLVCSLRSDTAGPDGLLYLNNDLTAANYTNQYLAGAGASPASSASAKAFVLSPAGTAAAAGRFTSLVCDIPDYRNTSCQRMLLAFAAGLLSGSSTSATFCANWWTSTAAVNRLTLTPSTGNWIAGSYAALYGIS